MSSASLHTLAEFRSQELSATAWAFAQLRFQDQTLHNAIATVALARIRYLNAQTISNIAWSMATWGVTDEPLLTAISSPAIPRISMFRPQELANTSWAFAKLEYRDQPLFYALSAESLRKLEQFTMLDLANSAWACASILVLHWPLLDSIASASISKISFANCQDLANTSWAFASITFSHRPLLDAISAAALPRISEFTPQNLSMTAWAFANLAFVDEHIFTAIGEAAILILFDFEVRYISSLLWSVSQNAVLQDLLGEMNRSEPSVLSMPWNTSVESAACEPQGCKLKALICKLASALVFRSAEWKGHSLCSLANALWPVRPLSISDVDTTCVIQPDLWSLVENLWIAEIDRVALAISAFKEVPVDPGVYVPALQATGCFHAGPYYTQYLLEKLGIPNASLDFVASSRARLFAVRMSDAKCDVGIMCYVDCSMTAAGFEGTPPPSVVDQMQFISGKQLPSEVQSSSCVSRASLLVSAPLMHDRSGHAEFLALCKLVMLIEDSLGIDVHSAPERARVQGTVRLYVDRHPCLSCTGAFWQFRALFPGVTFNVAFEWRAAAARGR